MPIAPASVRAIFEAGETDGEYRDMRDEKKDSAIRDRSTGTNLAAGFSESLSLSL